MYWLTVVCRLVRSVAELRDQHGRADVRARGVVVM
jgi:hypothetical protein